MTLQVATRRRPELATLKVRKSIAQMSAAEVGRFRKALAGMMSRPDNRGYQYFAGWHGVPLGICEHHNKYFLPWHRGYLYHFELALQEIDPEVTIPWWDWETEAGVPAAFEVAKVGGKANLLASAPIEPLGVKRRPGWPKKTGRHPGVPIPGVPAAKPPPYRNWVKEVTGSTSYDEFWWRCAGLHDNVHVWVGGNGGQMSDPNWAAFDPLFWAHHAMVDRIWRIWQHEHPGAKPDADTQDTPLTFAKGPSLLVRDVLDVKRLGYEYAAQTATVKGTL
jgi:tyrosinase